VFPASGDGPELHRNSGPEFLRSFQLSLFPSRPHVIEHGGAGFCAMKVQEL